MSITANTEYQVLLTRQESAAPEAGQPQCWRATVLGFPYLVAEACSREQALDRIKAGLDELLRQSEIVTVTAPAPPSALNGDDQLAAMGWDDYGFFANDPDALKLFDEIEEERNKHLIAPASSAALNEGDELAAQGYRGYGVFADDPEALKLFDEIEEERNKNLIEPMSPAAINNEDDELAALGYRHYGVFADDPEAMKLFDEIEEERNKHLIEPSQT